MYVTKDLFGILVIVSVNVINHVMLVNIKTKNCKCRKKLVDKLIEHNSTEECTENVEEAKIAEITLMELHSTENIHKCSSCTLHNVLFYSQHWNCCLFCLIQIHES